MKPLLTAIAVFFQLSLLAQGQVAGTVNDEGGKYLEGATVQLIPFSDSSQKQTRATGKAGLFNFENLGFGYYRLRISYVGLQTLTIDSIHLRQERPLFNLSDIVLRPASSASLNEVIIYMEKPLIQSKDGNITFNASESPLSNGSSVSELLETLPLVTKDPDGKVTVAGKEPKILIDEKPVNLNMQQLQDLLESMPGTAIEKIEVMTNPPPQYANEPGGVINIVTKKGLVGMTGRFNLYGGSRGELGANINFNYRKSGLVLNLNGGLADNRFEGRGSSVRQNIYADSSNHLKTANNYLNENTRPNLRLNLDYELSKFHSINFVWHYNANRYSNHNLTTYRNLNRYDELYRLSTRDINSAGDNRNQNLSFNYQLKTTVPGEVLKLNSSFHVSKNLSNRLFYQQFFQPDFVFTGVDSTQNQNNRNKTKGYNIHLVYDKPLANNQTFLTLSSVFNGSTSDIETIASYKQKTDGSMQPLDLLSNHFRFKQFINNYKASVRQKWANGFTITTGLSAEQTNIAFDLYKTSSDTANHYWSWLPFATIHKNWKESFNLRFSYRRSIRRPGINELNPTIDFSDPYNIRFGNPALEASTAHNFDVVFGKNKTGFFANLGFGYNIVQDIFSAIRTLQPDGKTEITWQNISGRREFQINTWNGYTLSRKLRLNLNGSYTYNRYSDYDKQYRNFRDGTSLSTNFNASYTWMELYSASGNLSFNRFANPQGTVRSTVRLNLGLQARLLNKKLVLAFNAIDPFVQQENRFFTYGKNFVLENQNFTNTRNFRFSVNYNISKTQKMAGKSNPLQKLKK